MIHRLTEVRALQCTCGNLLPYAAWAKGICHDIGCPAILAALEKEASERKIAEHNWHVEQRRLSERARLAKRLEGREPIPVNPDDVGIPHCRED